MQQEIKEPAPTSLALASLVLIWSEAVAGRQTIWQSVKESMETLEIRHQAVKLRRSRELPREPKIRRVRPRRGTVFVVHENDMPKPQENAHPRPAGHRGPWFE